MVDEQIQAIPPSEEMTVRFMVNGTMYTVVITAGERLLDTLRGRLGFKSVKEGCSTGECGACIVLVNGMPINSCITLTAQMDGVEIVTLEGIGSDDDLHPLQQAFIEAGAVQCGFCTPGMILSAKALLDNVSDHIPTASEIREALAGNLCRCTGYAKIVTAVQLAAERLRAATIEEGVA